MSDTINAQIPVTNRILAALPKKEYEQLRPHLKPVNLAPKQVVFEPGELIRYIYFPNDAVLSELVTTERGETVEVNMGGKRGMSGVRVLLGARRTPHLTLVQVPGSALRAKATVLRDECAGCDRLQDLLLRYTQAMLTQTRQLVACNRFHQLKERLCRWLLMLHDRVQSDGFLLTQEAISRSLGGHRESIAVTAGTLQKAGLIRYSRGHITILDRQGLEEAACECYQIIEDEYHHMFGL